MGKDLHHSTWEGWLDAPAACDHLVQLYSDDAFLARAVSRFVRAGFAAGEAAVIIAIPAHIVLFSEHLPGLTEALSHGQLVVLDAEACLKTFMADGMPDPESFAVAVTAVLDRVRAAGYPRIRLYGEMVDVLWQRDELDAAVRLEALWNDRLAAERLPLLCAYRIDNFDRRAHRRALGPIGRAHSHMIPVEHEDRLERAVDQAYADVFGVDGDPQALRRLMVASQASIPAMPEAQAALLALRDVNAHTADAVLERARRYYAEG
jgi:hypothetical protein